mmetsp:Transcript_37854/g.57929  ORF Transcript_37854/g.57929 Transcript_37854/m.57929 type:complete len:123 (-) Transcript_37854:70-438(-)
MQDKYISLNPENAASEEKAIKSQLIRQRKLEALGGQAGPIFGMQLGLTAFFLTYSYMPKTFKILPFAASKKSAYLTLLGAFFVAQHVGTSYVGSMFGNKTSSTYFTFNKGAIIRGTKPWEKE